MGVMIDNWSIQDYIDYANKYKLVYSQGKLINIEKLEKGVTYTPITKDWKTEQLYKLFKKFLDRK